ncbi:hypothetical protein AMELA_G00096120 [Ameiurus melas]|uniref:Uncharacterized protein n=1 Tax=Ameiurus melas TaxID=219545 RepID=A0A7J6AUB1_AMEME|nr:hypothetical protein AMELA_G00096120 [Ameiurus melas]
MRRGDTLDGVENPLKHSVSCSYVPMRSGNRVDRWWPWNSLKRKLQEKGVDITSSCNPNARQLKQQLCTYLLRIADRTIKFIKH